MLLHSPFHFTTIPFSPNPRYSHRLPRPFLCPQFRPLFAVDLSSPPSPLSDPKPPPENLETGPIELPPYSSSPSSIFAVDDNPSPLQVTTSVLLTGAISVFLYRSLRRRAQMAKDKKFRSSGAKSKDLKEEALERLRELGAAPVEAGKPPSAAQALLGGIAAGAIALVLYKFTTTIEAALNRQTISDNFSVRQITITIRTIINGLCYLATFVFGINSIGLVLYGFQLALGSLMEGSQSATPTPMKDDGQLNIISAEDVNTNVTESRNSNIQENLDDTKK